FQAEDGIRDRTVTGVQTCALPISGLGRPGDPLPRLGWDHCTYLRVAPRPTPRSAQSISNSHPAVSRADEIPAVMSPELIVAAGEDRAARDVGLPSEDASTELLASAARDSRRRSPRRSTY